MSQITVPRFEFQLQLQFQIPAKAQAQVPGSLTPMWATWIEFPRPSFGMAVVGNRELTSRWEFSAYQVSKINVQYTQKKFKRE